RNLPDAQIDMLCMLKGAKEIFELNPNLDNIIYFDFIKEGIVESLLFVMKLRKKYDVSFNVYPSNRKEYNIISFLLGAKKRFAVRYLRKDLQNFGFLNNETIVENDALHNVQENLSLVKKFLNLQSVEEERMEVFLSNEHETFANNFISEISQSALHTSNYTVGFHAGCATLKNHIKRRWQPEKFAELGIQLQKKYGANILLFGGPDEYELNQRINKLMDNSAIEVKTKTLLESIAIIKKCNLFVTNDSALMHIASALGLKIVAIFGPTNTNYVHPWMTEYRTAKLNLDCQPCFYYSPKPLTCSRKDLQFKCIVDLSVDLVMNEVEKFF
ncbi:MAG: glycosyltransferase family 9 protein, partial [Ignavibacteria bacterium]|nr:glycosyltransferase family 9 protein [Ignavibacteria bacterium]